jgi:hypothetical protein
MRRREFLKYAGLGSAALAMPGVAAAPAWAHDDDEARGTRFHFVVLSAVAGAPDRLLITGDGEFDGSRPRGGGAFDHFKAEGTPPLPLVATGTWEADKVLDFKVVGTHGVFEGGILTLEATFETIDGEKIRGVMLEVVCNLGPTGLSTGQEEGVTATVPAPVSLVFAPLDPPTGITAFTTAGEEDEDDEHGDD